MRGRLQEAFAEDQFYGEETGGEFGQSVWVVDPIDGTANFARAIPHFCISIAYAQAHVPMIGVIYNPITDEFFEARRGHGAHLNGRRMKCSTVDDLKRAQVELGWSPRRPAADYVAMTKRVLDAGASFRRGGSGALGVAYVADGRSDAYAELHINSWDCLAGLVMIEETGGFANDFLAGDGMAKGNPLLVAAPRPCRKLRRRDRDRRQDERIGDDRERPADREHAAATCLGRKQGMTTRKTAQFAALALLGAAACITPGTARAQGDLVLYCTVQEEWCRAMVTAFEKKTGIKVAMTRKSSGELYAQIKAKSANPKGDVWWGGCRRPASAGGRGRPVAGVQVANDGRTAPLGGEAVGTVQAAHRRRLRRRARLWLQHQAGGREEAA